MTWRGRSLVLQFEHRLFDPFEADASLELALDAGLCNYRDELSIATAGWHGVGPWHPGHIHEDFSDSDDEICERIESDLDHDEVIRLLGPEFTTWYTYYDRAGDEFIFVQRHWQQVGVRGCWTTNSYTLLSYETGEPLYSNDGMPAIITFTRAYTEWVIEAYENTEEWRRERRLYRQDWYRVVTGYLRQMADEGWCGNSRSGIFLR